MHFVIHCLLDNLFLFPGWTFKGGMLVNNIHSNPQKKVERMIEVINI